MPGTQACGHDVDIAIPHLNPRQIGQRLSLHAYVTVVLLLDAHSPTIQVLADQLAATIRSSHKSNPAPAPSITPERANSGFRSMIRRLVLVDATELPHSLHVAIFTQCDVPREGFLADPARIHGNATFLTFDRVLLSFRVHRI